VGIRKRFEWPPGIEESGVAREHGDTTVTTVNAQFRVPAVVWGASWNVGVVFSLGEDECHRERAKSVGCRRTAAWFASRYGSVWSARLESSSRRHRTATILRCGHEIGAVVEIGQQSSDSTAAISACA
jgi:hypothetical protein